ncbi:hypothetical protein AAGR22_15250 [Erwinia sp. HDF1-3R]|uniref:hypothetical protein n=1 Tax=Erwinia sp. HDF1-3R TaxID=3141543 RepID=UPI0031F4FF5C
MTKDTNLSRIKFINCDDGNEILAKNIKVVLPNNASFVIESEPGREGSVVFIMPWGSPEDQTFSIFSIEPGGANLFSVNVVELARRTD